MDEAYIDNDELLSQARKVASELADMDADEEAIVLKVKILAEMYYFVAPLTNIQLKKPNGFCESKNRKASQIRLY